MGCLLAEVKIRKISSLTLVNARDLLRQMHRWLISKSTRPINSKRTNRYGDNTGTMHQKKNKFLPVCPCFEIALHIQSLF
jgi:hypothetical protein